MTHEDYMQLSIQQAQKWFDTWNAPFWVVVVNESWILVREDHDRVKEMCDPTAHWEINAIRALCKKIWKTKLNWYSFYTTSEPCPTCLSACIKAQVTHIYYWANTEKTASLPIKAKELAKYSQKHPIKITWWILGKECLNQRKRLLNIAD